MAQTPIHQAKTVGELRALLADLPDDMPLHERGNCGEWTLGIGVAQTKLAAAKRDPGYFAAIESDPLWSQKQHRKAFGPAFTALLFV